MAKLEELRGYSLQGMMTKGMQMIKEYSGLDRSRLIVYNPRGGEIEAGKYQFIFPVKHMVYNKMCLLCIPIIFYSDIFIPFEMENLRSLPDVDINRYLAVVDKYMKKYIPDISDFCVWDTYYAYKPSTGMSDLLPPFRGSL